MNKIRVLFQGDSITDGNRYKAKEQEWDKNHQMGHSYAYIVNGILGSRNPERNFEFMNRGISGNRIIDLYARIYPDIIALKPDVLSIMVGVNDIPSAFNGPDGTDPKKYERIYRMLLDEVRTALPRIQFILCEPMLYPVNEEARDYAACEKSIRAFQNTVRKLAIEYHAIHVPCADEFARLYTKQPPSYWCWDGVHPTENGHGVLAGQWMKYTEELWDTL